MITLDPDGHELLSTGSCAERSLRTTTNATPTESKEVDHDLNGANFESRPPVGPGKHLTELYFPCPIHVGQPERYAKVKRHCTGRAYKGISKLKYKTVHQFTKPPILAPENLLTTVSLQ
jgi:hypothetical protein